MTYMLPFLDIFLGILGVGLSILFCTTFCRACHRYREEEIERRARQRSEQDGHAPSIYFIPFSGNLNLDSDDHPREPQDSVDIYLPPRYSTMSYGPPPSYGELGVKPEDLPPAYTEHNDSAYAITPPPQENVVQRQTSSEQ